MRVPHKFLDEIRARLTLSEVIGRRIKVTRAGREFKACCPFHKEKSPSFTINDDKGFYHCFGCGAHGDVIKFTVEHDGVHFMEAVEQLAADAGLEMPKADPSLEQKEDRENRLYELMDKATSWFEAQLREPQAKGVQGYLQGRGLNGERCQRFRIGFAPENRQALRAYLKGLGYTDKEMLAVGLVKASERSPEPYVFFRERVMFPVIDRSGRVVAFGGRVLPDHLRAPQRGDFTPAKYMNSTDTVIFDKGRTLYGVYQYRQGLKGASSPDATRVLITEGYMDVIACHLAGFTGALAPMGTALTEDQMLTAWRLIPDQEKVPILCFDGDNAGRRAAGRACERVLPLLKPGHSVRLAFLPDREDPDTLLRGQGVQAFRSILDQSMSLFDYIWSAHITVQALSTPEARASATQALRNLILNIADRDVQSHYQAMLDERIQQTFFTRKRQSSSRGFSPGRANARAVKRPSMAKPVSFKRLGNDINAKILLATILNYPALYHEFEEAFGRYRIDNEYLRRIKQDIILTIQGDPDIDSGALQSHLGQMGYDQEVRDILCESVYLHASFALPGKDSADYLPAFQDWFEEQEQRQSGDDLSGWRSAVEASDADAEAQMLELKRLRLAKTDSE